MIKMVLCGLLAVKLATPGVYDEIQDTELFESDQASDRSAAELLEDILLKLNLKNEDEPDQDPEVAEEKILLLSSSQNSESLKNVVEYTGIFDNTEVRLIIPYGDYSKLSVIDGVLCNIGSSSVVGRFLYGSDVIDPNEYETYSYYLQPVYNSPSNVYRYGSYNYRRHYYQTGTGIGYQDLYGKFYVDDIKVYYSVSERLYYALLLMLLIVGVHMVCKRN